MQCLQKGMKEGGTGESSAASEVRQRLFMFLIKTFLFTFLLKHFSVQVHGDEGSDAACTWTQRCLKGTQEETGICTCSLPVSCNTLLQTE